MSQLDQYLQKVNSFITLTPRARQDYTPRYNDVLKTILDKMKEKNELFKRLFNGTELAGSYVDNLKVQAPDEFDTVLKLKLPLNYKDIVITVAPGKPAYAQINVSKCVAATEELKKLKDTEGYLLQNQIHSWIESILTQILTTLPRSNSDYVLTSPNNLTEYLITYKKCGPAHTFNVKLKNSQVQFAMDLVPAFIFDEAHWIAKTPFPEQHGQKIHFYAVAKPDKNLTKDNRAFITSYASLERPFISDKNSLKNLIRLFKKMRDNYNISNLKSYYIKTVFLHKCAKIQKEKSFTEASKFWNQPLGTLFITMFDELLEYVGKGNLPFYWDSSYNMFGAFSKQQIDSMKGQLASIKKTIDKELANNNPSAIIKIFLTKEEIQKFEKL